MDPHEVREAIRRLPPSERAFLRPWLLARFDVRGTDVDAPGFDTSARPKSVLDMAIGHLENADERLRETMHNVGLEDRPATTLELLSVVDATASAVHALMLLCESARTER